LLGTPLHDITSPQSRMLNHGLGSIFSLRCRLLRLNSPRLAQFAGHSLAELSDRPVLSVLDTTLRCTSVFPYPFRLVCLPPTGIYRSDSSPWPFVRELSCHPRSLPHLCRGTLCHGLVSRAEEEGRGRSAAEDRTTSEEAEESVGGDGLICACSDSIHAPLLHR
jgi:hypothetical protein